MIQLCEQLDEYLDEGLSSRQLELFKLHLKRCPDCQQAVRFERALSDAARDAAQRVAVPAMIELRVLKKSKRRRAALVTATAVAAAGIALIPLRSFMASGSGDAQPTSSAQLDSSSPNPDPAEPPVDDVAFPRDDAPVATVDGDEQYIVVSVPTQNRQVTLVMLYPTVPQKAE